MPCHIWPRYSSCFLQLERLKLLFHDLKQATHPGVQVVLTHIYLDRCFTGSPVACASRVQHQQGYKQEGSLWTQKYVCNPDVSIGDDGYDCIHHLQTCQLRQLFATPLQLKRLWRSTVIPHLGLAALYMYACCWLICSAADA